jgi:hypothetical protein
VIWGNQEAKYFCAEDSTETKRDLPVGQHKGLGVMGAPACRRWVKLTEKLGHNDLCLHGSRRKFQGLPKEMTDRTGMITRQFLVGGDLLIVISRPKYIRLYSFLSAF